MSRPISPGAEEILGLYFPVLDHGFVSLVDYMGSDECIERAARVSYGSRIRQDGSSGRLLRYLHSSGHTSPSEMVEVKFHCAMPIFVARQWIRHRTANVNERSGRYSLLRPVFYKPEVFRSQATANKQGSKGPVDDPWIDEEAQRRLGECRETAINAYEWMTKHDIARELARIDLPLSTYTQWYWKIDLHNLMHFLKLRVDPHAQWEIQEYGRVMAGMFKRLAPLSYKAWIDYDVCGVRFSREERLALQKLLTHREREIEGGARDECDLALEGLTARERAEFFEKLKAPKSPCFELDLAQAREPSTFQLLKREGA